MSELINTDSTLPDGGSQDDNQSSVTLLQVENLTVRFGGVIAVQSVSLFIEPGECCALIGPNGAGKTTLFDSIAGQNSPASGRITYLGNDITRHTALWRARHGIRRTFQRQQVFPGLSVEENVLVAIESDVSHPVADILGLPSRRRRELALREQVEEVLKRCGLYSMRSDPAYTLPLGKARLLELARAIIASPRLVLLDEPTSGMEVSDVNRLSEILDELLNRHQCGVLLVEHDVEFAMKYASRVYAMHLGAIIAVGTPNEIQNDAEVLSVYLGSEHKHAEWSNKDSDVTTS